MSALGDNVRKHRRQAGLSQLELASAADLSPSTVAKVEQGGNCSMETLHTIARALNVKTSQLLAEDPPERERYNQPERLNLRDLRIALTPPITLSMPSSSPAPPSDEPDIRRLRRETKDAALLYPAGRYESLAATLPGLVHAATAAVAYYTDGEERQQALFARAEVLHLVGLYLTQIRQFDIAHTAVRGAIADAREADDKLAVAAKAQSLCFVLLRTGRFDEAEAVAVEAMDLVEPRITGADPDRYAVWGTMAMEAAAAAVRNNRPEEAREYRRAASVAATAIGREHQYGLPSTNSFGPVTAAMKSLEDSMIIGDARTVVRRAEEEDALLPRAWKRLGSPGKNNRNRFALDVARAHVRTGDATRAGEELVRLYRVAPNWLDQQNVAAYTWEEVAAKRKRTLTPELREVGRHLGAIG